MNKSSFGKHIWIITYNYGQVKAGPVIRFIRYAPFFKEKGYELIFITKQREGDKRVQLNETGLQSIHLECKSHVDFTKKVSLLIQNLSRDELPTSLVFFSVRYQNYFDFRRIQRRNIKLIYVSTMRLHLKENSIVDRLRNILLLFVLNRVYSLMDSIVSSTSELKEDFIDLRIDREKLFVIPNGVDTKKFRPESYHSNKVELRSSLELPVKDIIFLYVGLFVERKGVLDLIEIMERVHKEKPNVKLLMVGHEMEMDENSPKFLKDWEEAKSKAIDKDWLIVHPFSQQVQYYYSASDAFIFLSKLEGMPNVILESMSSGLPLFTRAFNGFSKDYGESNYEYVLIGEDKTSDVKKILEFLDNKQEFAELGKRARIHTLKHFSLRDSIEAYINIL